jgi:predicted nuclease with TOPRIM domain
LQDVYQQLVQDIKTDRDEQKAYIQELKEDRSHLRKDRDDLRKRQDELEESVRSLQREVARYGRMVANMRPFLCGLLACKNRTPVTISEDAEIETEPKTQIS